MEKRSSIIRQLVYVSVTLCIIIGCSKQTEWDLALSENDPLNVKTAEKWYQKEFANARVTQSQVKEPMWNKAFTTVFKDGTPVITVPLVITGLPSFTMVKRNNKTEKVMIPAPMLISYKDKKTNKYLFKYMQIVPENGTKLVDGRYSLSTLKGYVMVYELTGQLFTIFDVNKGKYDIYGKNGGSKNGSKNGKVSSCTVKKICYFTSGCFNSNDFAILGTSSDTDASEVCITPPSPPSYPGMNCGNWESNASEFLTVCYPDPDPSDPAETNPIDYLWNIGGGYDPWTDYSKRISVRPNLCDGYAEMLRAQKEEQKEMFGVITTDNKIIILPSGNSTKNNAFLYLGPVEDALGRTIISIRRESNGMLNAMLYYYTNPQNVTNPSYTTTYDIKGTIHTHPIDWSKVGWDSPSSTDQAFASSYPNLQHYILHNNALIEFNSQGEMGRTTTRVYKNNLGCR
jgi:hypothetical protein